LTINDAIPILVDKLQRQKLVLFVGAGLSRASGLPDWKELFAPFCKKLGCPDEENYPAVATTIIEEKIYPRKEIIEHIVEKIGDVEFELNENHYLIKRLPFKIIITTNYDNLLEELYGPTKVKRIYSDDGMAYFDPLAAKIQLIYLHGDINHPVHMLVSSIDYQGFADTRPIMVQKLKSLLQEYTFLFIGYSANDPNLHAIFDYFRLTYKEDAQRHFIALAGASKVKQVELRSRFGIEPIILKHYSQLTIFLKNLVEVYENPAKMKEYPGEEESREAVSPETLVESIKARGEKFFERARIQIPVDFKPKAPFNVPGEDPHFTGREVEIALVKKALLEKQTVGVTGLLGMGGIGKTSLAKHVTHMLHREGYFKDGICWHRLEAKVFPDSLDEIADVFGAHWLKEIPETAVRMRYFMSIIQDLDVLFILDNAEYIENIPPLLELFRNHPVLITSRRQLSGLTDVIDIDRLDEDKSLELFIKTWKQEDDTQNLKNTINSLSMPARNILHRICNHLFGGLPLAISIAASFLRFKKNDILDFTELFEEKKLNLLKDINNIYKLEQKNRDIKFSFDISFDQLPARGLEQFIFMLMGIMNGEEFPIDTLYEMIKNEKRENIDNAVNTLNQYSLVHITENKRLVIHPLLKQYAAEKMLEYRENIASLTVELVTQKIEKITNSIIAIKISNKGLVPVKNISIEVYETKIEEESKRKNLLFSHHKSHIPQLEVSESWVLEINVTPKKTGIFPLYIYLYYTDAEVKKGKKDSFMVIKEQLQVVASTTEISRGADIFINPYLTGRPVQSPEMFFGRWDILEWIKKRLCANNIIILYGQRRTGKTSTLFQLKNVVYKDTAVPVFLTLLSMMGSDKSLFFFEMAEKLYQSLKDKTNLSPPQKEDFKTDPQYQLELFLEAAINKTREKPIIYLIDEFEGLFQMIKEKRMDPSVLDNLRSIMQHFQQVWFLLAGTHALKHAAADYQSALFNIATFEKIGPLDEKDARDLVIKPLAEHIEYEPYAVDKIISLTNCHPYFIQMICFELVIYLETNQLRKVTVKEVNHVVDEILKKGSSHFEYYWDYLTEAEQRFLSLLAENIKDYESFISMDRARDFCKGKFKPGIDIYKLISGLIEKDLLLEKKYRDKRHIGFFMDFFKRWTLMHHPSDDYQRE
jgi:hypothetical protein